MSKLFREDRLSFEREKKRMIDEVISSAPTEELKKKLREMQASWDTKLKNAGSESNRFVLAKFFFWRHFDEVWQPTLQKVNQQLNKPIDDPHR